MVRNRSYAIRRGMLGMSFPAPDPAGWKEASSVPGPGAGSNEPGSGITEPDPEGSSPPGPGCGGCGCGAATQVAGNQMMYQPPCWASQNAKPMNTITCCTGCAFGSS